VQHKSLWVDTQLFDRYVPPYILCDVQVGMPSCSVTCDVLLQIASDLQLTLQLQILSIELLNVRLVSKF